MASFGAKVPPRSKAKATVRHFDVNPSLRSHSIIFKCRTIEALALAKVLEEKAEDVESIKPFAASAKPGKRKATSREALVIIDGDKEDVIPVLKKTSFYCRCYQRYGNRPDRVVVFILSNPVFTQH